MQLGEQMEEERVQVDIQVDLDDTLPYSEDDLADTLDYRYYEGTAVPPVQQTVPPPR